MLDNFDKIQSEIPRIAGGFRWQSRRCA